MLLVTKCASGDVVSICWLTVFSSKILRVNLKLIMIKTYFDILVFLRLTEIN